MKAKKLFRTLALTVVAAATVATAAAMTGCGPKKAEGSATIDAQLTASNSTMMPAQVSSMVNATTEVKVQIDGSAYTLTKIYSCPDTSADGAMPGGKGFKFEYVFTGDVTSSEGDTYELAPATTCNYSVEWGYVGGVVGAFMTLPVENGNGTNEDNADCLNYFYSPYVKKNEDNKKSMKVNVKDGGLTFEGFDIAPEE